LRPRFRDGGALKCLGEGASAAAIRFVVGRTEAAAGLPVDQVPQAVRSELTEALVAEGPGELAYERHEALLWLRHLERERGNLSRASAEAEQRGDFEKVTELLRQKMKLDARLKKMEKVVAGRKSD
jgi:hypothetical protein